MMRTYFVTRGILVILVCGCCVASQECLESWTTCRNNPTSLRIESTIVCCADPDLVPEVHTLPDDAINCTCVSKLKHKYDVAIEEWARQTDDRGRMCEYEAGCSGATGNSSINGRFTFCCRKQPSHTVITVYNGNDIRYIGCRCVDDHIPYNTDRDAYVVPDTRLVESSGESCSYNAMCDDHPRLACVSPLVTFCCYGSRGMKLRNQDNHTECTCTHEFFGKECVADPIPIPGSSISCLTTCGDKEESEKCIAEHTEERCCPHYMRVNATLRRGVFTECSCSMALQDKICHDIDYMHAEHVYLPPESACNVLGSTAALVILAAFASSFFTP